MTQQATTTDPYDPKAFHEQLVAAGMIMPTGIPGGWGRSAAFEDIIERFDALVLREAAGDGAETVTFPPVVARTVIERLGYLEKFPQLIGSIHSFFGDELQAREMAERAARGERWEDVLKITELMLVPAVCYPIYPMFSGLLSEQGRLVTTQSWCFRHEPSDEPTRLQFYRVREYVRAGKPEDVEAWRDAWLQRALKLLQSLALPVTGDVATDPFFGRAGRMMATSQREQRLKFEITVPVISREKPTAICSFNWHQEFFTSLFGIHRANGELAQTACLGFGLERVVLALLKTHGCQPKDWPAEVRQALWS